MGRGGGGGGRKERKKETKYKQENERKKKRVAEIISRFPSGNTPMGKICGAANAMLINNSSSPAIALHSALPSSHLALL